MLRMKRLLPKASEVISVPRVALGVVERKKKKKIQSGIEYWQTGKCRKRGGEYI